MLFAHAGGLLLTPPNDLYLSPVPPHNNYYYYPPFFAIACLPLNWLPEWLLLSLWAITTLGAFGWLLAAFYAAVRREEFSEIASRDRWVALGIAGIFVLRPLIDHLRFGQVNVFVLAGAVLSLCLLERRRDVRAGIVLGLSTAVKLLIAPLVFAVALRKKYLAVAVAVVTIVAAAAVPAAFVGFEKDLALHREWFNVVLLGVSNEWTTNGNISLAAQVMRFFTAAPAFEHKGVTYHLTMIELSPSVVTALKLTIQGAVLLVIGYVAARFRSASDFVSEWGVYALVFALIPCFTTITEIPHLVLLAPPAIWLAHAIFVEHADDRLARVLFGVSFILITFTSKTFVGEFLGKLFASTGVVILGVILLAAAVIREMFAFEKMSRTTAPKL